MVTTEMEKAGVRVFSGRVEDWFDYQDEVLAFFASRDLKEVLKTARPAAEGQEAQRTEWDKRNAKIYSALLLSTSGLARMVVSPYGREQSGVGGWLEDDGKAAWEALQAKYASEGHAAKVHLQQQLGNCKMGGNDDPLVLCSQLEKITRQLSRLGVDTDDSVLLSHLYTKLPPSFNQLVRVLQRDKSLTYMKAKEEVQSDYQLFLGKRQIGGKAGGASKGQAGHRGVGSAVIYWSVPRQVQYLQGVWPHQVHLPSEGPTQCRRSELRWGQWSWRWPRQKWW